MSSSQPGPTEFCSQEPATNIRATCDDHAPRPDPSLHVFAADHYIGKHVKIPFTDADNHHEHMWVKVSRVVPLALGRAAAGHLANIPTLNIGLAFGDEVWFYLTEIEAIL